MAASSAVGHASRVGQHYSQVKQVGLDKRDEARIIKMRNFNNFIKSLLINMYTNQGDTVFDMASGKGGDLNKWSSRRVRHVTFADVASESVQQSRERYEERHKSKFSASFHVGDLTRAEPQRWEPPLNTNLKFDVVSCQFALHYCFESQKQCKTFVRNAAQNLKRGGYFFGTTIWSEEVVRRFREAKAHGYSKFGNDIFSVKFPAHYQDPPSIFNAVYNYQLEEQVNIEEFLVYFPVLEDICRQHGLKLIMKKSFGDFFKQQIKDEDNRKLLERMNSLETVTEDGPQTKRPKLTYKHAEARCGFDHDQVGTLSKQEWECASLYVVFAFKKE